MYYPFNHTLFKSVCQLNIHISQEWSPIKHTYFPKLFSIWTHIPQIHSWHICAIHGTSNPLIARTREHTHTHTHRYSWQANHKKKCGGTDHILGTGTVWGWIGSPMFVGNSLPPSSDYSNKTRGKMIGVIKGREPGWPQHLVTAKTHNNMKICPCTGKPLKWNKVKFSSLHHNPQNGTCGR